MEILTNHADLVGKKIVFSYNTKNNFILATEDGCILMTTYTHDDWVDNVSIRVAPPREVIDILHRRGWLRNELGKLGIFDLEKYEEEQKIKKEKEQEEFAEYLRLKEKFEHSDWNLEAINNVLMSQIKNLQNEY